MSKSSGNVLLVKDVIEKGLDPLSIRLSFLEHRYRSQMDLTWNSIKASSKSLNKLREKMQQWAKEPGEIDLTYLKEFENYLNEDLDTNKALQVLKNLEKDETIKDGSKYKTILKMDEILGLDLNKEPQQVNLEITAEMQELLDKRAKARVKRNWKLSDELRNQLNKLGVEVKDTENGQELAVISD